MSLSKVYAFSQKDFNNYCSQIGVDDSNVENFKNSAFISIIGTPDVLKYYLSEEDTQHYFKSNHDNVLNVEFDDVDQDIIFNGHKAYALTDSQAKEIVEFIEHNLGKDIFIHCRAGVSRSAALLNYIIRAYNGDYETDQYHDYSKINKDVVAKLSKHLWTYINDKLN